MFLLVMSLSYLVAINKKPFRLFREALSQTVIFYWPHILRPNYAFGFVSFLVEVSLSRLLIVPV